MSTMISDRTFGSLDEVNEPRLGAPRALESGVRARRCADLQADAYARACSSEPPTSEPAPRLLGGISGLGGNAHCASARPGQLRPVVVAGGRGRTAVRES